MLGRLPPRGGTPEPQNFSYACRGSGGMRSWVRCTECRMFAANRRGVMGAVGAREQATNVRASQRGARPRHLFLERGSRGRRGECRCVQIVGPIGRRAGTQEPGSRPRRGQRLVVPGEWLEGGRTPLASRCAVNESARPNVSSTVKSLPSSYDATPTAANSPIGTGTPGASGMSMRLYVAMSLGICK